MGMSSSQARLLTLTSRQHDIEYKAQKLEAQKLQMANESRYVFQKYENALNSYKIQGGSLSSDGSLNFINANLLVLENNGANKLAKSIYLKNIDNDKIYVSQTNATKYNLPDTGIAGTEHEFMNRAGFETTISSFSPITNTTNDTYAPITNSINLNGTRAVPQINPNWGQQTTTNVSAPTGSVSVSSVESFEVGKTYTINNLADLQKLQTLTNSGKSTQGVSFMLTSDIDMSSISNWSGIGITSNNAFKGTFDGNGYIISNLKSTTSGLFKYVTGDQTSTTNASTGVSTTSSYGIIKNVTLKDVNINGTAYDVGALIGTTNRATISNCSVSGNIQAAGHVGGLVGDNQNTAISNSTSSVNINSTSYCTGGFTGHDTNGILSYCVSDGNVTSTYSAGWVGGFIGHETSNGTTFIYECATRSKVTGVPNSHTGLFIGEIDNNSKANIINSLYSDSTGSSTSTTIGQVTNPSTQILGDTPLSAGATRMVNTIAVTTPNKNVMTSNINLLLDKSGTTADSSKISTWLDQFYLQNDQTATALTDEALKLASINDTIANCLIGNVDATFVNLLINDINNNSLTSTIPYQDNYTNNHDYEYTAFESTDTTLAQKSTDIQTCSIENIAKNLYTALRNNGSANYNHESDVNQIITWLNTNIPNNTSANKLLLANINEYVMDYLNGNNDGSELANFDNAIQNNTSYSLSNANREYNNNSVNYSVTMNNQQQSEVSDWDINNPDIVDALNFYQLIKNGYIIINNEQASSDEWLANIVDNGIGLLIEYDITTQNTFDTNIATNVFLQQVKDDKNIKLAEAEYEADMRKINNKDKKYDIELASLDNERNAIKTEIDTLKTVAKDNIDRTFKLFG